MLHHAVIDQSEASALIQGALAEATRLGRAVSVAVCDAGGHPVALLRMDGAGLLTPTVAMRKARTAALLRAPSAVFAERARSDPALLRLEEYLPMGGGVPLLSDSRCIGAIGISGGTEDEDIAVANAALSTL